MTAILACGLVPLSAVEAFAAGQSDLIFQINEAGDGYIVYECNQAASGKLTIPSFYKSMPVVGIGDYSFIYCEDLTAVEIPDTVISIGECAFVGCTSLKSLTIPETVLTIGTYAYGWDYNPSNSNFYHVSGRKISGYTYSVAHDYSVLYNVEFKSIGKVNPVVYALNSDGTGYILTHFSVAYDTDSFDIPDTYKGLPITEIGDAAFANCSSLLIMTMPDTIVRIGNAAFAGCKKLGWEHFSENVESIGYGAFYDTPIFNNENSRYNGVIYYENYLVDVDPDRVSTNVNIYNGTKVICDLAFMGCENVEQIHIPGSVKNIGLGAFVLCPFLEKAEIEYGVEKIGDGAFYACDALKSITIPESVTEIGEYALGWTYDAESESLDDILLDYFEIRGFEGSAVEKYANKDGIKFVALTKSTDESTEISVAGDFAEGAMLNVKKLGIEDDAVTFDISLTKDGADVELEEKVFVKIPVPEGLDGDACKVYRKEVNGTYTNMKAVCDGTDLVFSTDRFGEYVITTEKLDILYGDANGDGKVDLKDVVLLRQYMANYVYATGISSIEVKFGADANGDGKVDLKDVVLLRQYMANYSYYTESSTVVLGPR